MRGEFVRNEFARNFGLHYIFLEVDPFEGRKRSLLSRGIEANHFDERKIEYYNRVARGYKDFRSEYLRSDQFSVVDANLPLDQVCSKVLERITTLTGITL